MALWIADSILGLKCTAHSLPATPGCFALCKDARHLFAACTCRGICLHTDSSDILFDFPLPPGVCSLCRFGDHICALSTEADCLCAFSPHDGTLCLSAPAGSYPRDVCISPCGRYAAVAGSAAGEVLVFDRQLNCIRKERVAGAAVGVCFLPRSLAVLCAVGDDAISTRLIAISPRGVTEEIFSWPQPPCCLCALPGGRCLVGCHGTVIHLNASGRMTNRTVATCPHRICLTGTGPLIADSWQGTIRNLTGQRIFSGREPVDLCET